MSMSICDACVLKNVNKIVRYATPPKASAVVLIYVYVCRRALQENVN